MFNLLKQIFCILNQIESALLTGDGTHVVNVCKSASDSLCHMLRNSDLSYDVSTPVRFHKSVLKQRAQQYYLDTLSLAINKAWDTALVQPRGSQWEEMRTRNSLSGWQEWKTKRVA